MENIWKETIPCSMTKTAEVLAALYACLNDLDDRQWLAIYLRFWVQVEIVHVASALGSTRDEADRLIDGAILNLRKMLELRIQDNNRAAAAA